VGKRGSACVFCAFLALIYSLVACSSTADPIETADAGVDASGPTEAGAPDDGGDAGCQDDDGFLPSCDGINGRADVACDRATCERYVKRMKTRLARRAIQCMTRHIAAGGNESCRPCSAEALATSCTDSNAPGACGSLVTTCPTRRAEECIPLISGLTFGGRINFVSCVTADNCLHDMPSCLP
jgi:hypothetical protein